MKSFFHPIFLHEYLSFSPQMSSRTSPGVSVGSPRYTYEILLGRGFIEYFFKSFLWNFLSKPPTKSNGDSMDFLRDSIFYQGCLLRLFQIFFAISFQKLLSKLLQGFLQASSKNSMRDSYKNFFSDSIGNCFLDSSESFLQDSSRNFLQDSFGNSFLDSSETLFWIPLGILPRTLKDPSYRGFPEPLEKCRK